MKPVYMYHGVGSGAELDGADRHYAVTTAAFERHLTVIRRSVPLTRQVLDAGAITAPSITFDDGHVTHFTNAFPALAAADMQAEFYVNTAVIGQPGFVTWEQLKEMAAGGMSIQSHGHHHVFFADLDLQTLHLELERSKKTIEDALGEPVIVFAPPGGRYDDRVIEVARSIGYQRLAVSRPGLWRRVDDVTIPRFPIYAQTGEQTVTSYHRAWSRDTLSAVARYRLVKAGQSLLGNQGYDRLRNSVLGEAS